MQWNLRALFLVSTIMGFWSCISSLLLLYFALTSHEEGGVFNAMGLNPLPYGKIVMLIYLKVAVSDFLTLFSARTGPLFFWKTIPARMLMIGATLSLAITTIISCVFPKVELEGRDVEGLARGNDRLWPLWCWIYCIIFFFIQDAFKVQPSSPLCNCSVL
jgi:H+-transporting ATPase